MYSTRTVEAGLKIAAEELGYELVYHSVDACDEAADHFDHKLNRFKDEYGEPPYAPNVPKLTFEQDELKWIANEKYLCQLDYLYFATRYAKILNADDEVIHYNPNIAQLVVNDARADLEDRGWAIMMMWLKGRQCGITTDSQVVVGHRTLFFDNIIALTGSSDKERSKDMVDKYKQLYEWIPYWLKPEMTRDRSGTRMEFGQLNSKLIVQHGAQKYDIGRGNTPSVVHLCISGRTLVRTKDSRVIPMRELVPGHKTISPKGALVGINAVTKSPRSHELTSEIRAWGTPTSLSCTRDHKILTESGWKQAGSISRSDKLVYPVRPITGDGEVVIDNYEVHAHKPTLWRDDFKPTFELGRLVGLYLAEGCIFYSAKKTPCTVAFAIHQKEDERVRSWIESVFGENRRATQKRKTSKTVVVTVGHRGFAHWLIDHFGTKDDKRVPDICWTFGREFCRGLVYGYLSGDGHYAERDNCIYATSVRVSIPIGVREMIASLGYGWSQISFREAGLWYNRNCRAWIMTISGTTSEELRRDFGIPTVPVSKDSPNHWHWMADGRVAVGIESVSDGFSEDFYDVEVEDPEHAYLTASGIVANSEVASYLNAEDLIDAGLVPAVHESARKLVILESTGEGPYGWWFKTWTHCKKFYWKGQAKFRPGFIPWFVASDLYPTPTWLKRAFRLEISADNPRAIREASRVKLREMGWLPQGVTAAHAERAKKFVRANDLLRRYFPENWEMPLEQMYFWEIMREEYKAKKILARFLREFASDDLESFAASGESVFDVDVISDYNNSCQEPVGVFGFRAPAHMIPPRLQADEHDRDKTRRIIDVGPYQLVPLRWQGWQTSDPTGKLLVFEWPEQGEEYGFGVDTGDGVGLDRTVLEGLRKGSLSRRDGQICEFASEYVNANDFAAICHCIGLFYQGAGTRQPKMAIETGLNGEVTQLEMRKMGWANFHSWVRYDRKKMDPKGAVKIGFVTNRWSRPMVIDYMVKALRDGELDINSPEFVREMQSLHRDEGMQDARAEQGQHDDRFMALGIIYLSLHILEISGKAQSISYLRQKRETEVAPMYREILAGDDYAPLTVSPQVIARESGGANLKEFFAGSAVARHPGSEEHWENE